MYAHRCGTQLFPGEDLQHSRDLVRLCVNVAQCALKVIASGEHAGVDYEPMVVINDAEWDKILGFSYKAAAVSVSEYITHPQGESRAGDPIVKEAQRLTTLLHLLWSQRSLDGHRNIWVVKAPDAGR